MITKLSRSYLARSFVIWLVIIFKQPGGGSDLIAFAGRGRYVISIYGSLSPIYVRLPLPIVITQYLRPLNLLSTKDIY